MKSYKLAESRERWRSFRRNTRGTTKYAGWILLFAVGGTLAAVAAVAISEGFVPSTLLVLTTGEWELVAAIFYILAILLYLGEGMHKGRAVARVVPRLSFKEFGQRRLNRSRIADEHASLVDQRQEVEA